MTPEQTAAINELEAAIIKAGKALDTLEDSEFVASWMVSVFCDTPLDSDKTSFFGLYANGTIPVHHAVGMLECHKDHLLHPDD